ncbi:MAG: mechanosensitive ion channel family protein, partial [Actinomycetota bacterium]|nr:mechanosensitive ion channel family protein [Actinomycetota bacterium]
ILCILVGAWILTTVARRLIKRAAYRIVLADPELSRQQLARLAPRRLRGRVAPAPGDLDVLIRDPRRHARATSISTVLGSTVTVLVWTVAFILVLGQFDIDLAPLIAGAGIAGVALGFGAQSLVKDCLTGLFMLIEDQFGIGDVVNLGEVEGTVEAITLRATVLRGVDGTVWHVPNGVVLRVGNKSQRRSSGDDTPPRPAGGEDGAAAPGVT